MKIHYFSGDMNDSRTLCGIEVHPNKKSKFVFKMEHVTCGNCQRSIVSKYINHKYWHGHRRAEQAQGEGEGE